ncbi:MAG: carbohydrate-binding domain-containing protein, partial [Alistipes sp.]|nr:carbohydrate-binding domain-containing protein [Alistipes sp.]
MNRKTKYRFFPMIAIFCFILLPLTACGNIANADPSSANIASGNSNGSEGIKITLTGNSAQCDSNSVSIGNGNITIGNEGTYLLSGTLQDGMIVIAADDNDKVRLIFDGVSISNGSNAAIFVQSADKVFITLNDGTTNILENGGSYTPIGSTNVDSVIFAKCDLTIDGGGSLQITAAEGHGVVTKDDLKITDGTFTITAKEDGFNAGKTIRIDNGAFTINAGDDGFHGDEAITVNDGSIDIATCNEGIEGGSITISGGYIKIHSDDDGINAASDTNVSPSLLIAGGTVYINARGDGIDSNGSFSVTGGALYVSGPVDNANSAIDYETSG